MNAKGIEFFSSKQATEEILKWSNSVWKYYNIKAVATVILKDKDKEIGRIVETAQESVEKDLLQILNKNQ